MESIYIHVPFVKIFVLTVIFVKCFIQLKMPKDI